MVAEDRLRWCLPKAADFECFDHLGAEARAAGQPVGVRI